MEDDEQLLPTSRQGPLLGFPRAHLRVGGAPHWVVTHAHQGGPVAGGPHVTPATPAGAPPPPGPALAVERRQPPKVASCWLEPWPRSGRGASSVRATVGPPPGTRRSNC